MASQPPAPQDLAPRPQVKQPPPKKEKLQCLFCTKPARLTCPHKLCKKCCNERHPNDCKAHDTGLMSDRDKLKAARVQALPAAQPLSSYAVSEPKSAPLRTETSQRDQHLLKPVPPGPHTSNLTEAVQAYSQEAQERARWQAAAYSQVQHQHSEDAQEALQHYVEATHLLKQLCQASVPNANDSHEQGNRSMHLLGGNLDGQSEPLESCQQDAVEVARATPDDTTAAPTPTLTNIEQEKNAEAPAPQEMSANLLVSTASNVPSPRGQVETEVLGTDLFATLNTVHVKYRGFFVERSICCGHPLREYLVKPCVRGFSEIPTDAEFDSGELSLVMDDHNPGRSCWCLPGYFKRLTVNAKDKNNRMSFTLERPCACPITCLPWPFNCTILSPLKVFVRGATGGVLGYAQQVTKCCNCSGFIQVMDASNQLMYTIEEPCCQSCVFTCCLPNMCCKRNRLTIHPANSHDTVGEIVHTYPGCSKSCCSAGSNFFVAFPPSASPDQKAMLMSAAFLANYLYFRGAL